MSPLSENYHPCPSAAKGLLTVVTYAVVYESMERFLLDISKPPQMSRTVLVVSPTNLTLFQSYLTEWHHYPSMQARNLGVILDASFLLPPHVHFINKACKFCILNSYGIHSFLSVFIIITLLQTVSISCLEHNSFFLVKPNKVFKI